MRFDDESPVWALGFSEDGSKLAIGLGESSPGPDAGGWLIVVSTINLEQTLGRAEYRPVILANPAWSGESRYSVRWAPGTNALNLGDAGAWKMERNARDSWTVNSTRASCNVEGQISGTLTCTVSGNGTPITLAGVIVNGPFSVGGTRVAVSQLTSHTRPRWVAETFDVNGFSLNYKRRLIWDFVQNRIIASWTPEMQPTRHQPMRSAFALSPDGKLLAEGASGSVRLFAVGAR